MRDSTTVFPSYTQYSTGQLLNAFTQGPDRLRAAIVGLDERELRARARASEHWSAHEIVIHTTDSEIQGAYRIRKIWAQPGCDLPTYDQDLWARELDYLVADSAADRENALQLFGTLRRAVTPLFARAKGDAWDRWGTHPDYGRVTLHNMLELYADHAERHVEQILHLRMLLGKALNLPMLLPDRLY